MAVGISLAFVEVNILITAAAIGFATFTGDDRRAAGAGIRVTFGSDW
jgi:putative Mn2+ efflux pump MntP